MSDNFAISKRHRLELNSRFTHRQDQFLAFFHPYSELHRQGPAELDFAAYFGITPPAVHGMLIKPEKEGLITRMPGLLDLQGFVW